MEKFFDRLIAHALQKVDPCRLILDNLRLENNRLFIKDKSFDLDSFENIHVIGAGKGAPFLWEGLNTIMGDRLTGGVVVSPGNHSLIHDRVQFITGSHPAPDQRSLDAGKAVGRYVETHVGDHDLVFFLITGGASALMVEPAPGIRLEDKIAINKLLLASGAEIDEINRVRKQMSALKGGKLAQRIYPARVITLVLSDIVDSPLEAVGSGPTIPGGAASGQALAVLRKYGLLKQLSPGVQDFFQRRVEETPVFPGIEKNVHFLLGHNRAALEAARDCAREQNIPCHILTSRDKGEASEAAKIYAAVIKEIIHDQTPFKPPVLLLSGGELTVTLAPPPGKEPGRGGRNQAFVLHMLNELKDITHPFCIASIGTDGIDGPTDAAGAWIDQRTAGKAQKLNLDINEFLETYDSYNFFQHIDQQIKTGPTRTNVMDLRLFYVPDASGGQEPF
jgi:glycerate-2-kinase